ncbi:MAG TPA: hypothetical protein VHI99_00725 [Vicinamibacterales bacterium]|nr:hypothetical protein [Vicinamibacterales bacterium]
MDTSRPQTWIRAALLVGVAYLIIGRLFALPIDHARAWRLAAWVVSGVTFAAHIGYEHVRLRSSPGVLALHTALAVALGAFGLAVAGALHSLSVTSSIRPLWLLALVAWPVFTAVPAFLAAFVAAAILSRVAPRG